RACDDPGSAAHHCAALRAALRPGNAIGRSARLAEPVVERIAGPAHSADRVDGVATVERLAQAADMDGDGALVDIDGRAPDAIEQLLAGKHPAGALHQEFEQPELGRPEIDRAG